MTIRCMTGAEKWFRPWAFHCFIAKTLKVLFSETVRPRPLIRYLKYHLMVLYQVCSNYEPQSSDLSDFIRKKYPLKP